MREDVSFRHPWHRRTPCFARAISRAIDDRTINVNITPLLLYHFVFVSQQ